MRSKIVATLLVSSLLSGCAFKGQLHDVAINHNKLVADTANEITLLNILRARDRMPRHYTSMSKLSGNAQLSVQAKADFSLPEVGLVEKFNNNGALKETTATHGNHSASPSISATMTTNPSFEVDVYDNQEFQRGILAPVDEEQVEFLIQQGRPDDFLAAMLLHQVDIVIKDGDDEFVVKSIRNSAKANSKFADFIKYFRMVPSKREAKKRKLMIERSKMKGALTVAEMKIIDGESFDLDNNFIYRKEKEINSFTFVPRTAQHYVTSLQDKIRTWISVTIDGYDLFCPTMLSRQKVGYPVISECKNSDGKKVYFRSTIRSPEAVLYFLGRYVRNEDKKEKYGYSLRRGTKILVVESGRSRDAFVTTRFGKDYYHVKKTGGSDYKHRSSQALELVQTLFNMNKDASELPVSNTVRLQ